MKKAMKIIAIILCVIAVLGISGTVLGVYIQGGIDKYTLPDGFDGAMQQVDSIKTEYGVPVFCIGDFNTMNPGEGVDPIMDAPEIYEELCKTLTDTRLVAQEKANGDALTADAPTWDHIFLSGEAQINRYAIVSPQALSDMSDHYPIFADVKL